MRDLIAKYSDLDHACRADLEGDAPECDAIGDLPRQIRSMGWCWGRDSEATFQATWHGCEADSSGRDDFEPFRLHYEAVMMPETIDVVGNALESSFGALLTRSGYAEDGSINIECRRGREPKLSLLVDRYNDGADGKIGGATDRIAVEVQVGTSTGRTYVVTSGPPDDPRSVATFSIDGRDLVLSALGTLYDEGTFEVRLTGSGELPFERATVVLPDDQRFRDMVANVFVGCESS